MGIGGTISHGVPYDCKLQIIISHASYPLSTPPFTPTPTTQLFSQSYARREASLDSLSRIKAHVLLTYLAVSQWKSATNKSAPLQLQREVRTTLLEYMQLLRQALLASASGGNGRDALLTERQRYFRASLSHTLASINLLITEFKQATGISTSEVSRLLTFHQALVFETERLISQTEHALPPGVLVYALFFAVSAPLMFSPYFGWLAATTTSLAFALAFSAFISLSIGGMLNESLAMLNPYAARGRGLGPDIDLLREIEIMKTMLLAGDGVRERGVGPASEPEPADTIAPLLPSTPNLSRHASSAAVRRPLRGGSSRGGSPVHSRSSSVITNITTAGGARSIPLPPDLEITIPSSSSASVATFSRETSKSPPMYGTAVLIHRDSNFSLAGSSPRLRSGARSTGLPRGASGDFEQARGQRHIYGHSPPPRPVMEEESAGELVPSEERIPLRASRMIPFDLEQSDSPVWSRIPLWAGDLEHVHDLGEDSE